MYLPYLFFIIFSYKLPKYRIVKRYDRLGRTSYKIQKKVGFAFDWIYIVENGYSFISKHLLYSNPYDAEAKIKELKEEDLREYNLEIVKKEIINL